MILLSLIHISINAGYMVLEPRVFDYIEGDQTIFEKEPLNKLATECELMSYTHKGFWQCMDTVASSAEAFPGCVEPRDAVLFRTVAYCWKCHFYRKCSNC